MTNSENPQGTGPNYGQQHLPQPGVQPQPDPQGYSQAPQQYQQPPAGYAPPPNQPGMVPGQQAALPPAAQPIAPQLQAVAQQFVQQAAQDPISEQMQQHLPEAYSAPVPAPVQSPATTPLDDYQYPQAESILPDVPSVAMPPAMEAQIDPMSGAPAPMQAGYGQPGNTNSAGEQISQRLAQLQNQYDEELSAENINQAQGQAFSGDPYSTPQQAVDEGVAYSGMPPEYVQPQNYQQAPQGYQEPPQAYIDPQQQQPYAQAPEAAQHNVYGDPFSAGQSPIAQEALPTGGILKKVMMSGAFVAALAAGSGAAYTYQYTDLFGAKSASAPAPTVKAASSPIKIIKQKLAGARESLNKVMHNRLGGNEKLPSGDAAKNAIEKMANKSGKTANVGGKKIAAATAGMLPGAGNAAAKTPPIRANAPRRVKTLIVRPDGTILRPAGGAVKGKTPAPKIAVAPDIAAALTPKAEKAVVARGNRIRRMKTIGEASSARRLGESAPKPVTKVASRTQIRKITRKTGPAKNLKINKPAKKLVKAAATAPSGAIGTPFVVQVTSRTSQTGALAAYADMQQKYPALIGAYAPDIQRADLGVKGVWYRLRVGPVNSKTTATDLCASLKQAGHPGCFVRRK